MKNHPFNEITVQLQSLTRGSREDIIEWLQWNDRNDIWADEDSEANERTPLTLEEARNLMLMATDEERTGLHVITQHVAERL